MNNKAKLIKIREAIRFNNRIMSESGDSFLNHILGSFKGLHIISPERIVLKFVDKEKLISNEILFSIQKKNICRMAIPFDSQKYDLLKIINECNKDLWALASKCALP